MVLRRRRFGGIIFVSVAWLALSPYREMCVSRVLDAPAARAHRARAYLGQIGAHLALVGVDG